MEQLELMVPQVRKDPRDLPVQLEPQAQPELQVLME